MLQIGQYNTLKILRGTSVGFYLGNDEGDDVLLPHKYIPEDAQVGQEIRVFVYNDSEDRPVATTLQPLAVAGEFACMQVVAVNDIGAFVDWGLEKDLLIPFREQSSRLNRDDYAIVRVVLDETTQRLIGSTKTHKFLKNTPNMPLSEGQEVDLLLYEATDLGFKVIIDNQFRGMIYRNEIFQPVGWGDAVKGYVKGIRPDLLVDCSLQPIAYKAMEPNAQRILDLLKANNGTLPHGDKTDPTDIQAYYGMSKKNFKRAVGQLYKNRQVTVSENELRLVEETPPESEA